MKQLVLPNQTIGIIGGGQLGRMMSIAAKQMGYKVLVLDPTPDCPALGVCDDQIVSEFNNLRNLEKLCSVSDVITYEFENVDVETMEKLAKTYNIPQSTKALRISQHRLEEKTFATNLNIPTPNYKKVNNLSELLEGIEYIGIPCVLKTSRFGYDGKGQKVIRDHADLADAAQLLDTECILEEFIPFDFEISVIVTRGLNNTITFPIPLNIHRNQILYQSIVPSHLDKKIEDEAKQIALKIVEDLNYIGTMAIELFVSNNKIYFNEMAPRPHNSGHYTIEGCTTSQFRSHIEAICGLTIQEPRLVHPTTMVNVLGQDYENLMQYMQSRHYKDCSVHLYGKSDVKENRKMGHITFYGEDVESKVNLYCGGNYE